ncbi:hypothetical protein [Photobacterium damselae]|uniref:hypothetical protein n=1 Tax=Photobacterium damselae TaxID=38293 RepID=UPI00187EA7AF|nr:hypothetical protein [Photobacterium damselae]MBE8128963.1 hypothetical protein [Photobacterium damselae subsp. piscicida]
MKKKLVYQVSVVQFDPEKIKAELLLGAQYGGLPDLILVPSDFLGLYKQMKLSSISKQWIHTDFEPAVGETAVMTPIDLLMVKFTFYKRFNNLIVHLFAFRKTNGFSY